MSTTFQFPQIHMELCETDISELQKFILNEKVGGEFTEDYLILYNFADDCRYSKYIQPELIRYLLPFYLKTIEQAVIYENKIAVDIYFEFNKAIFFNKKNLECAIGEKDFEKIMGYYINETIKSMEMKNEGILDWISLFNTTIAFGHDNIRQLFHKIFDGSIRTKYSFFQFLSVLLFKESDNLLAVNESRVFWASDIWDFDDGDFTNELFWNDDIVDFFDKEITRGCIETLYNEVKPLICETLEPESVCLFSEEMAKSFSTGIFNERKAEYLKKISCKSKEYIYWDSTF